MSTEDIGKIKRSILSETVLWTVLEIWKINKSSFLLLSLKISVYRKANWSPGSCYVPYCRSNFQWTRSYCHWFKGSLYKGKPLVFSILTWYIGMGCRLQQKWLTSAHSKCHSQDENYFTSHGSWIIFSHNKHLLLQCLFCFTKEDGCMVVYS